MEQLSRNYHHRPHDEDCRDIHRPHKSVTPNQAVKIAIHFGRGVAALPL